MKNRFTANIFLSKKFRSNTECDNFFNSIELEESRVAKFDLGIFLTSDIKEPKPEMFLINLVYEEGEGEPFHPLGTNTRVFEKIKKNTELIVFRDNEVNFKWDGLYTLELRLCNRMQDIDDLELDELIEFIDASELINSFSFIVEAKK